MENIDKYMYSFALMINKWLQTFAERPDMLLMNGDMMSVMQYIGQKMGYYAREKNDFGNEVTTYRGIALVDAGHYYDGTGEVECVATAADTGLKHDGSWTNVCASAFSQQSSCRYKDHIEDMTDEDALKILRLRPVKYDYTNKSNGTDCRGLIAEEVDEVMTYPVVYDDEGQPDGIDYSKFVPYLIKTVQIQQEEINGLRAELGKLKETVAGITA